MKLNPTQRAPVKGQLEILLFNIASVFKAFRALEANDELYDRVYLGSKTYNFTNLIFGEVCFDGKCRAPDTEVIPICHSADVRGRKCEVSKIACPCWLLSVSEDWTKKQFGLVSRTGRHH